MNLSPLTGQSISATVRLEDAIISPYVHTNDRTGMMARPFSSQTNINKNQQQQQRHKKRAAEYCTDILSCFHTTGTMGKSKSARRRARREQQQKRKQPDSTTTALSGAADSDDSEDDFSDLLVAAAAWAGDEETAIAVSKPSTSSAPPLKKQKTNIGGSGQRLPPTFPTNLPTPSTGFLRNEEPYRESFQAALTTAYEGCVWDEPEELASKENVKERAIQTALNEMNAAGLFRTDVTQPAGMGSRCVKTYVTRCLLGDEGTTYKYLGLRMFSHPWKQNEQQQQPQKTTKLQSAIHNIWELNQALTQRTQDHLKTLERKRMDSGGNDPAVQGRAKYSITLINKMKVHSRLKDEPMFGDSKCSVSWHADSSL